MGYKDCTISNELRTSLGLSPESIVFIVLLSYFQTLTSYELLVLSSNFLWPLKKVCFQTEMLGKFVSICIFYFILLFTSSSSCGKDQFVVSYFYTSCYFTDQGLHLGDPAPLIGLSLWTC